MSRLRQFLAVQYRQAKCRLTDIRDTPHAIAGGVAIGLLFGFTPLLGFKTLLAVLLAWLFRCSKLSAALAVTFHDILWPILPAILRWQYQIGFIITSHPHHLPPKISPKHIDYENLFSLKSLHFLWPTFVGSVVLGIPVLIAMYFVVLEIVTRAQALKARQIAHGKEPG